MVNIYQAITDIMSEGYTITKDKRNQKQGYAYRGIDDVMNTFQPLLSKHHVFVVPEVLERERQERVTYKDGKQSGTLLYSILTMRYTFYAEDGSSVSAVVIGEGMDSGDKASNKAMSVAMKYAMFQVFCIPTEEMQDPDAETPEPSKPKAEQPTPEPVHCADCGAEIQPYQDGNGKTVGVDRWSKASMQKFGRVLCTQCADRQMKMDALRQYPEVTNIEGNTSHAH